MSEWLEGEVAVCVEEAVVPEEFAVVEGYLATPVYNQLHHLLEVTEEKESVSMPKEK